MTKAQRIKDIIPQLERWAAHKGELDRQFEALRALMGCGVEAPLPDAVWRLWDSYTDTVSKLVGDTDDWLPWYSMENAMGAKGLEVQSLGGRSKKIRTLRDLAAVICD
jgi:hypothetical protein